jgi:hypothetical protein
MDRNKLLKELDSVYADMEALQSRAVVLRDQIHEDDSNRGETDPRKAGLKVFGDNITEMLNVANWTVRNVGKSSGELVYYSQGIRMHFTTKGLWGNYSGEVKYLDTVIASVEGKVSSAQRSKKTALTTDEDYVKGVAWAVWADLVHRSTMLQLPVEGIILHDDKKLALALKKEKPSSELFVMQMQLANTRRANRVVKQYLELKAMHDAFDNIKDAILAQEPGTGGGNVDNSIFPRTYTVGDNAELRLTIDKNGSWRHKVVVQDAFTDKKLLTINSIYLYFGGYSTAKHITIHKYAESIASQCKRSYQAKTGIRL